MAGLSWLQDALVGTTLAERFRLDRVVGSGGFGVVFAGHHTRLDVPIAVKVLHVEHESKAAQQKTVARFVQEAKTLAQLRHPHIARVLDTGTRPAEDGLPELSYLVLEWCPGPTLAEQLASRASLSHVACWRLFRPIVDAVAYAHEQNVVHRDLKPDNIILVDGSPRVLDFGIAKVMVADETVPESSTTRSDYRAFTPAYAAPEQIAATRTGPWTDVHALGLIFTELLVGTPPYMNVTGAALIKEVLSDTRPTPKRHGVDAGPWEAVIERALSAEPAARFQDARALLNALDRAAPVLDTVHAMDDDTVDANALPPARAQSHTTPMPPRPTEIVDPRTVAETQTFEPATVDDAPAWRAPVRTFAVVAAVVGAAAVYQWTRPDAATPLPETTESSASPSVSSVPQPAPASRHGIDDYDIELIERRLLDAGWTIDEARLRENHFVSEVSRFNISKGKTLGLVTVQNWQRSADLHSAIANLKPLEGVFRKKTSCLLYAQVTGDHEASQRLFDLLDAGGEAPIGPPKPVEGSPWTVIPVATNALLRGLWTDHRGTVFAVGHHGVVLRREDGEWRLEKTPTDGDLLDVWGRSKNDVFAVGESGLVLHLEDGSWTEEKTKLVDHLYAVGGNATRTVAVSHQSLTERLDGAWKHLETDEKELDYLASVVLADDESVRVVEAHDQVGVYRSTTPGEWVRDGAWPKSDGAPLPFVRYQFRTISHTASPWTNYADDLSWQPLAFSRFGGEVMMVGARGIALSMDPSSIATKERTGTEAELHDVLRLADGTYIIVGARGLVLERRP